MLPLNDNSCKWCYIKKSIIRILFIIKTGLQCVKYSFIHFSSEFSCFVGSSPAGLCWDAALYRYSLSILFSKKVYLFCVLDFIPVLYSCLHLFPLSTAAYPAAYSLVSPPYPQQATLVPQQQQQREGDVIYCKKVLCLQFSYQKCSTNVFC